LALSLVLLVSADHFPATESFMEMHQIRYFLAVAETLNFTRAAEACHVSQPSLSQAIRKLEEELDGDLFRRERNRTHLTDLGRSMHPLLCRIFESAEAAKGLAASYKSDEHAPLRIGLSLSVSLDVIAPMLAELAGAFPGLELHVVHAAAGEVMKALKAGDIELGVAADLDADWDRLDHWPMFEEGFVLLAPPDWAQSTVKLSDIDENSVIARPYCETLAAHQTAASAGDAARRQRHEVSSDEDAAKLVGCGMGVAIVPESSGRSLAPSVIEIDDLDLTRSVQVYGVAGRQRSGAASGMLKLLRVADWSTAAPH
jgi:DNA-binding transcriptional LysR family regulator